MAKAKLTVADKKKFAQEIFKYWEGTQTADQLKIKLSNLIDKVDKTDDSNQDTGRKIEVDFVFDTNLDANTRLVWITIPIPDPRLSETVNQFIDRYWRNLSSGAKAAKEQQFAEAVLFGCGR
jgi:hypothetical protein